MLKNWLKRQLENPKVQEFLKSKGYDPSKIMKFDITVLLMIIKLVMEFLGTFLGSSGKLVIAKKAALKKALDAQIKAMEAILESRLEPE